MGRRSRSPVRTRTRSSSRPPGRRRFSVPRLRRTRDFSMPTARRCRCSRTPNSPRPSRVFVARNPARTAPPKHWSQPPRLRWNSHSTAPTSALRSRAFWQSPANREPVHSRAAPVQHGALCAFYSLLPPHMPMLNLLPPARTYRWRCGWGDCMTSFRPTEIGQLAIEAKLSLVLGAETYDGIFSGFEVLEVVDGELRAWAPSEHQAAVIDVHYSG